MNALEHRSILLLLAAVLSACSLSGPVSSFAAQTETRPSISEIATNYTNFHQMTRGDVLVNPEFAVLCVPISKERMDAARSRSGPHANTAIVVYMNDLAAGAFRTNAATFPVGAVIVKQKTVVGYTDKGVRRGDDGVGGMFKRSAVYDSKPGYWEYFYFEDFSRVESGRISSCVQCHESAKSKDYVFGSWSKRRD